MAVDSSSCFDAAKRVLPGGVNSPVRSYRSVGGRPLFIARGWGPHVETVDGETYIDYVGSWGPAIAGHAHPEVVAAVQEAAGRGLSFGACTPGETELATIIAGALPAVDRLRFVCSGTEACMSALRLARAYTGRTKIIKFTGNYHGHADLLLVKAGSGVATLGLPDSHGVPAAAVQDTIAIPYNDTAALAEVFAREGEQIAGVIVEAIVGNSGFIRPVEGFLEEIQRRCQEAGALFILDEVMTGFRVSWGGVQTQLGLTPDLTTLGKVIGGGMPIGAYGGRAEIMAHVAPEGAMYQAGTLAGNPLAMAAGIATLNVVKREGAYAQLHRNSTELVQGLVKAAHAADVPLVGDAEGGFFGCHFNEEPVRSYEDAQRCDSDAFVAFFHGMLAEGILLPPSSFEAGFMSLAHGPEHLARTVEAAEKAMQRVRASASRRD